MNIVTHWKKTSLMLGVLAFCAGQAQACSFQSGTYLVSDVATGTLIGTAELHVYGPANFQVVHKVKGVEQAIYHSSACNGSEAELALANNSSNSWKPQALSYRLDGPTIIATAFDDRNAQNVVWFDWKMVNEDNAFPIPSK